MNEIKQLKIVSTSDDELKISEIIKTTKNVHKSNTFYTTMNIMNTIVGAGVISLPRAFTEAGVGLSYIILFVCAIFANFTMVALAKSAEISQIYTYQGVVKFAFGKIGLFIVIVCQILFPICAILSYNVVIADNLVLLFEYIHPSSLLLQNRLFVLLIPTLFLIVPLVLMRNISFLDKFSAASIFFVLFYTGIILYEAINLSRYIIVPAGTWNFGKKGIIQSLNMLAFALSCHHNVLPIYRELKDRSISKFHTCSHLGVGSSLIIFIIVAISGYTTFGGNLEGNLLNDYCPDDVLAIICRGMFSLTLVLTTPLNVFASREVVILTLRGSAEFNWCWHIVTGILIVFFCYFVGGAVTDLQHVISLTGSLVAAPIVFIIPSIVLFKILKKTKSKNKISLIFSLVTAVFGFFILIIGSAATIYDMIYKPHILEKYWCKTSIKIPSNLNQTIFVDMIKDFWNE